MWPRAREASPVKGHFGTGLYWSAGVCFSFKLNITLELKWSPPFFSSLFTDIFTHFPSAPSKHVCLVYLWVVFHVPVLLNSTAEGGEPQVCTGRTVLRGT